MRIGLPREIKEQEYRVGLTPAAAHLLVVSGHEVRVEAEAGVASGFADAEYASLGCRILPRDEVWAADLVVKVKEPQTQEYRYFRPDLTLFCYLHLAPAPELTAAILDSGMTAIGLETVQLPDGRLPLLAPMSQIAGRMSVQVGTHFLQRPYGTAGLLPGGIAGVPAAHVVVIGGGTVGVGALRVAVGLGARATVLDTDIDRLRMLDDAFGGRVVTLISQPAVVAATVAQADVLIGAVLVPGARTPRVVTEDMVRGMRSGSVVVDVAVDQGGCIATADHVTTHSDPVFERYGVLHYAVANMPGAVPATATHALSNATLPYVQAIGAKGWRQAAQDDASVGRGVNAARGQLCCAPVAVAQGRPWVPIGELWGA